MAEGRRSVAVGADLGEHGGVALKRDTGQPGRARQGSAAACKVIINPAVRWRSTA